MKFCIMQFQSNYKSAFSNSHEQMLKEVKAEGILNSGKDKANVK